MDRNDYKYIDVSNFRIDGNLAIYNQSSKIPLKGEDFAFLNEAYYERIGPYEISSDRNYDENVKKLKFIKPNEWLYKTIKSRNPSGTSQDGNFQWWFVDKSFSLNSGIYPLSIHQSHDDEPKTGDSCLTLASRSRPTTSINHENRKYYSWPNIYKLEESYHHMQQLVKAYVEYPNEILSQFGTNGIPKLKNAIAVYTVVAGSWTSVAGISKRVDFDYAVNCTISNGTIALEKSKDEILAECVEAAKLPPGNPQEANSVSELPNMLLFDLDLRTDIPQSWTPRELKEGFQK